MSTNLVLIRENIFVPRDEVDMRSIKEKYETRLYEENVCKTCEYRQDRHSYTCDTCPAFKETIVLYNKKTIKGVQYIGLPVGDKHRVEKVAGIDLDEFKIVDLRTKSPFDYKIKFEAKLRPVQEQLVADFLKHKYGLLQAPPRTGKTLTSLYIALKLGQRVVVMANQHEFLTQFMDHIHGNEEEGIPKCTNLPELEQKYGKKLYGFPKKDSDYEDFQFIFTTYQALISKKRGADRLKLLNKHFGTVFIDEAHKSAAHEFASTVSKTRARYRFACSGTINRKDGKEFLVKSIIGPVVAKTAIEALVPTVYVHKTEVEGRYYQNHKSTWVKAMQYLSNHKKRNQQIVDMVMKDLHNGHNIVIPVMFKKHVLELQAAINKAYGSHICGVFVGGGGKKNKDVRKALLTKAKNNEIRCIVGIRSLLQLGLNVPTWSAIYTAMPISNEPNYKQETSRVCTPLEGKRPPIIRIIVDLNQGQSVGCARNCLKHCKGFNYAFSATDKQKELVRTVLSSGSKKRGLEQDGDYTVHRSGLGSRSGGLFI